MSSKQEAKIYQSPIPSRLSDDLQWESLLRMIVSSFFFGVIHCIIYKADNGEILAQRRNNILTKYWRNMKILGNWKKLSGLHQLWKKIFHKCPNLCCYVPSEATMWRCWDGNLSKFTTFEILCIWPQLEKSLMKFWSLEVGGRAWRGRGSPALYISSRPTQSNVPRESKLAE